MTNFNVIVTDGAVTEIEAENTVAAFNSAVSAAASASAAESLVGPVYASTAAGISATSDGDFFAVNDTGVVTVYLNSAGTAVEQRTLATTAALSGIGGAGIIGTIEGNTVQESINNLQDVEASLLDLTNAIAVTSATALAVSDINRLIVASGATAYTINLPLATLAGAAVKIEIARSTTAVITIQAASGSGKTINTMSAIDMIAGESALFVYDGTNWRTMDWARVPIVAEMLNSGAATLSLTTGAFTDVAMATAGTQLMQTNLSALWNVAGGYFTAPRPATYAIDFHVWLEHSSGPGQYDVGAYTGPTSGATPLSANFIRQSVGTETFRAIQFRATFGISKGDKIFPCVRPLSPLSSAAVVAGASLQSRITVTEFFRA